MQFIFSTGSLYTYNTDRCFAFAAAAGFDGIELMVDHRWDTRQPHYLERLMATHGLPIRAVHSPFGRNWNGWADDEISAIQRSTELAETLGAAVVIHHLPPRFSYWFLQMSGRAYILPKPLSNEHQPLIEWLQDGYARLQERTDVLLCIENMPARRVLGRRWNHILWNTTGLEDSHEIARFPYITMDTTHLGTWGLDPTDVYVRWGERVRHVHLSNFDGREHRRPETGQLDLQRLLARMAADGYDDAICLELHPDSLDAGASDEHIVELLSHSLAECRRWASEAVAV